MIGRSGERGSGISVLEARPDDIYMYIYMCVYVCVCVCEEKLTTCNPNGKGRFIEKQRRHYSVSVLLNHHQGYEGLY